jgi:hypothetical protein
MRNDKNVKVYIMEKEDDRTINGLAGCLRDMTACLHDMMTPAMKAAHLREEWLAPYMGIYYGDTLKEYTFDSLPEDMHGTSACGFDGLRKLGNAVRCARMAASTMYNTHTEYKNVPAEKGYLPVICLPDMMDGEKYRLYALVHVRGPWFSYWGGMPDTGRAMARMASAVMTSAGFTAAYIKDIPDREKTI